MRTDVLPLMLFAALLLHGCEFWPRDLEPLAESISRQVSGETTAWLASGDIVVIDVAGSPHYSAPQPRLEALATVIAEQAIGFVEAPLESIAVTFHEGSVSDDPEHTRQFIFVVTENRPVLQPDLGATATGPLTAGEIQAAMDGLDESYARLGKPLPGEHRDCVLVEAQRRARAAGDPNTLDPANVEFLAAETWYPLDDFGKRLVLTQAIMTKALFVCVSTVSFEVKP